VAVTVMTVSAVLNAGGDDASDVRLAFAAYAALYAHFGIDVYDGHIHLLNEYILQRTENADSVGAAVNTER
jgi:hypothetical protein